MYMNGKNITFTDRSVGSINHYLKVVGKTKPLSKEEEYQLWLSKQNGSQSAREQLIEANLGYVVRIAKKYLPSKAYLEDLIQSGNEGLVRAVDKFDASLGFHLISYATWFIENEVRKMAYNHINHHAVSLDETIETDDKCQGARIDRLAAYPNQSADWNLRYTDALNALKSRAEERQFGLGRLTAELHQMLLDGYTTSDFARRHRLGEQQMTRLLTILREEAGASHRLAA